MENIEIVSLNPNEWELYKQHRLQALKEEPQAFTSTYEEYITRPDSYWKDRLTKAREGHDQWLLFAKHKDKLVGMAGAYSQEGEDIAEIIAVYVTLEYRGLGIAKDLMNNIQTNIAKNEAIKRTQVVVNGEQIAAFSLYTKVGFAVVKRESVSSKGGKTRERIIMERSLLDYRNV